MLRRMHLGATGPLSLLLFPKCPLCLLPLLAPLGITAVSRFLSVAGVLICVLWLIAMLAGRRFRISALVAATAAVIAIAMRSPALLAVSVIAMSVVGGLAARACARDTCSLLDTAPRRA